MRNLPVVVGLVVSALVSAVNAAEPPEPVQGVVLPTPKAISTETILNNVRLIGFEGLSEQTRAEATKRVHEAIGVDRVATMWPHMDTYKASSLTDYPISVGTASRTDSLVPIYMLVDPGLVDKEWHSRGMSAEKPIDSTPAVAPHLRYGSLDATEASSVVVYTSPTDYAKLKGFLPYAWPSWADEKHADAKVHQSLAGTRWSVHCTTLVGFPNALAPGLQKSGVAVLACINEYAVSPTLWRAVYERPPAAHSTEAKRGVLVFSLWESLGLLREPTDPWKNDRNGPMSTHVESPDFQWRISDRSSFVLPAPRPTKGSSRGREYVVLPETFAKEPIPIMSIYKAKTWRPFAEDYVFRVGPPTTTEGLRAVCVFMTATDEQLREVAKAMCRAETAKAEPKTEPKTAEPSPAPGAPK